MTSHIQLIIRAGGDVLLQDILRDYKKFTSKAIRKAVQENVQESRKDWLLKQFETTEGYRFWRGDNKPIELWSNKVIDQKIDNIHLPREIKSKILMQSIISQGKPGRRGYRFQGRRLFV